MIADLQRNQRVSTGVIGTRGQNVWLQFPPVLLRYLRSQKTQGAENISRHALLPDFDTFDTKARGQMWCKARASAQRESTCPAQVRSVHCRALEIARLMWHALGWHQNECAVSWKTSRAF